MTDGWKRRLIAIGAIGVAAGALFFIAFSGIDEAAIYYWSPTELAAAPNARNATVRLGGLVEPGSLSWDREAQHATFRITDGEHTVAVDCTGNPPQMFREGIGVVVEGRLGDDDVFHTDRVMVKHSNEYQAPDEAHAANPYETLLVEES